MHDDVHAHLPILSLLTLCYAHLFMLNVPMHLCTHAKFMYAYCIHAHMNMCSHMLITALVHKRPVLPLSLPTLNMMPMRNNTCQVV